MDTFNYNFVFFYVREDYLLQSLGKELIEHPQVRVYSHTFNGAAFWQRLYHLHTSFKLNSKIEIPLKSFWFQRMYNQGFNNDLPICFIYLGGNMVRYDGGFTRYVKKKDPRNRVVMLHWDLISKKIEYDYNIIRDKVDLAITYDKEEAQRYGIHYFQETTYSKPLEVPLHPVIKQDVYFLGAAKDRLDKLYSIYRYLIERGLRCKFLIAGVPANKRIIGEGLEYITNITYKENIKNVIESNCILEVVQRGSSDVTIRVKEAIAYERRLITDCPALLDGYFNQGQLICFHEIAEIDSELAKAPLPITGFPPKLDMNPLKRLYDIQEQLEEIDGKTAN